MRIGIEHALHKASGRDVSRDFEWTESMPRKIGKSISFKRMSYENTHVSRNNLESSNHQEFQVPKMMGF